MISATVSTAKYSKIMPIKPFSIFALMLVTASLVISNWAASERKGIYKGAVYDTSNIETINDTNGNLFLHIPLATLPAGRGGDIQPGLSLFYNSKLWKTSVSGYTDINGGSHTQTDVQIDPDGGWRYGLRYGWRFHSRYEDSSYPYGGGSDDCFIEDVVYQETSEMIFPDGSRHTIHPRGFREIDGYSQVLPNGFGSCSNYAPAIRVFYTTDGSGIRIDFTPRRSGTTLLNPAWTMYFPDGHRVTDDGDGNQTTYDRNGNYAQVVDFTYNGHSATKISDQLGREIILEHDTANSRDYVYQQGYNGEQLKWTIMYQSIPLASKQYFVGDSDQNGNPIMHQLPYNSIGGFSQIQSPAQLGGLSYNFSYDGINNNGELKTITLPSGAQTTYGLGFDNNLYGFTAESFLGNGVVSKTLNCNAEYDGNISPVTETWLYHPSGVDFYNGLPEGISKTTAPNGAVTEESYLTHPSVYPFTTPYTGLEGLPIRTKLPDGSVTERIWQLNKIPSRDLVIHSTSAPQEQTNAFVKTEFTSLADASGNLTKTAIKDFNYDKNGNVTQISEYDFVPYSQVLRNSDGTPTGIPAGSTPLRVSQNNYYNATPDSTDTTTNSQYFYANSGSPNIHKAIAGTEIAANGIAAARQEFFYDNYSTTGNLTETKSWDSSKSSYSNPLSSTNSISTTTVYDPYGNPTLVKDANGNFTQITYGSINGYTDLYPTQTITAYGTAIQRTSSAQYDFSTGLVTIATDVDNNVSNASVYDALGRPTITKAAVGTAKEVWTQIDYNDAARRVITKSDLSVKGDGRKVGIQYYDQLGRVFLTRTLEDSIVQSATNVNDGIKVQTRYLTANPYTYQLTSNPYRAATAAGAAGEPSMGWTRSKSVNTGKHTETETFSGASLPAPWGTNASSSGVVATDIDTDKTLATDQTGKQRISRTNALGQMKDVWEITAADSSTVPVSFANQSSAGYQTGYQYDALNNLTTVNQGSQTRSFSYTSLARLKQAQNPESGLIQYTYDNNGNLTNKTDARGVVTTYGYDALNRVMNRSYSNEPSGQTPTLPVAYTYDDASVIYSKGKLTKVTTGDAANPFSVTKYIAFDQMGRVTGSQQATDGVIYNAQSYVYNLSGALTFETYPSGRVVKNVFDNGGDLSIVQSKKTSTAGYWNYAQHFSYTAAGGVGSMQLGNGKWESTQFNSRLQPTQIALGTVQNGTDNLLLNYTYSTTPTSTDNNGNVLSQIITVPTVGNAGGFTATQNYTYDSLSRLKSATESISGSQSWKQTFTYDRYGNRNFDTTGANTTTLGACSQAQCNPTIDAANNRFTTSQGYSYDFAGNVVADAQGRTFVYDAENKQTSVSSSGSSVGTYYYDGDGKRVKKYIPSTQETTIFVYDAGAKMVAEYATTPSPTPQVSYLTNDNLGTPRINTNANGAVIARHDYMPFGEEIDSTITAQRNVNLNYGDDGIKKKFTGYIRDDETNLDFAKARMFGSGFGRFTSPDPLAASAKSTVPQSWNRYAYVLNNPLKFVDPSGMVWGYYDERGERHFHYFKGDAGKFDGHTYVKYSGSLTISNTNAGRTIRLSANSNNFTVLKPLPARTQQTARASQTASASGSSSGSVNHEMVNQLARSTEPIPRAVGAFAATATVAGVACAALCPAIAAEGVTTLGLNEAGVAEGETFFEGATYTSKVANQMSNAKDIQHAFPESVDGFATKFGRLSTEIGGDGESYQWLRMSGSYEGKTGTFEYIKNADGIINHRYLNPTYFIQNLP